MSILIEQNRCCPLHEQPHSRQDMVLDPLSKLDAEALTRLRLIPIKVNP